MLVGMPKATASLAHLEETLLKRHPVPLRSWERETGRGVHHAFGEYRLMITTSDGAAEEVIIEESCTSIATRVWDCAVVTTKWLERRSLLSQMEIGMSSSSTLVPDVATALKLNVDPLKETRPTQVLELGAGLGLLSICLAKMGAAVLSTEYGAAVAHLKKNCVQNNADVSQYYHDASPTRTTLSSGSVLCRELDWYKTTETLRSLLPLENDTPIFDLIVVTDCSLSTRDSIGVLDMIQRYGTRGHTKCLVGLCREREGTSFFIDNAQKLYPSGVSVVPTAEYHEQYQTNRHIILLIEL